MEKNPYAASSADRKVNAILLPLAALAYSLYLLFCEITGWSAACMFHLLTGWDCPGCGCQRAIHAAWEGDWAQAWRSNLLLPFAIIYIILLVILPFLPDKRSQRFYSRLTSPAAGWMLLTVILLWWLIRNILHL